MQYLTVGKKICQKENFRTNILKFELRLLSCTKSNYTKAKMLKARFPFLHAGADPGEVKRVNFHHPFFWAPFFLFCFLSLKYCMIGSNTLLEKFTPHFKILDPRLTCYIISFQSNTRTTLQHLKKFHCQINKTKKSQSECEVIVNLNAISFCYCV